MRNPSPANFVTEGQDPKDDLRFRAVEDALAAGGPGAVLDCVIDQLTAAENYRALLDALLLKARHELGLPLVTTGSLADLPEPVRTHYEERYVAAVRLVGSKHLDQGDITTAYAYFRAIAEPGPVAQAIRDYVPDASDDRLGSVIEIAFHHGVEPKRGFELILEHHGTCPAITAFEQLSPADDAVRVACAGRLIRHLHHELTANVRADIARRGEPLPDDGTAIRDLIEGRPWLFADEGYHIDVSHLSAVVRSSTIVKDPEFIALAADLTEYGRRLSARLVFEGHPPFEQIFEDHRAYCRALLGDDVEAAITRFRAKLNAGKRDGDAEYAALAAQVLVNLLVSAGRMDEAIEVAREYLADLPETVLACPTVAQLCDRAGQRARLAQISRERGDLVGFATGLLKS
jgi:hypothetical protein